MHYIDHTHKLLMYFHTKHILGVLKEFYKIEEDWTGSLYCGITLDWHYDQQYVDISMINYVLKQFAKYKQPPRKTPQHCPFETKPIQCGKLSYPIPQEEPSPLLDKDEKKIHSSGGWKFSVLCPSYIYDNSTCA